MANDEGGEKTEEATGHKLSEARKKGQVPKSMEVTSAMVLLAAGGSLVILGPLGWDRLMGMFRYFVWRMTEFDPTTVDLWPWFYTAFQEVLILVLPLAFIIMIVSVAVNMFQIGGFMVVSDAIVPKLDKLNFIKGFARLFKVKSLVECVKSILKLAIIGYFAYLVINSHMEEFAVMSEMEPVEIGLLTLKVVVELFYKIILVLLILGFFDFAYQKWQFMRDMRMTKQEIKDEY